MAELIPTMGKLHRRLANLGAVAALSDDPRFETQALTAYQTTRLKLYQLFLAAHARLEKQSLI